MCDISFVERNMTLLVQMQSCKYLHCRHASLHIAYKDSCRLKLSLATLQLTLNFADIIRSNWFGIAVESYYTELAAKQQHNMIITTQAINTQTILSTILYTLLQSWRTSQLQEDTNSTCVETCLNVSCNVKSNVIRSYNKPNDSLLSWITPAIRHNASLPNT